MVAIELAGEMSFSSPHPHFQIRHRRPNITLGSFRYLAGDGDGSAPPPGEEGRENLVIRGLEPDLWMITR